MVGTTVWSQCAKHCAYTLFCCTVPSIFDFSLVQVYLKLQKIQNCTQAQPMKRHQMHTHSFESQTNCSVELGDANFMQFSLLNYVLLFSKRNVARSSQAMEMLAFKQCMEGLLLNVLLLYTFITDCHISIAKYMRENLGQIKHFDVWHLKKSWVDT